jgi:hypothetical protein
VALRCNYLYRNVILHDGAIFYEKHEISDKYVEIQMLLECKRRFQQNRHGLKKRNNFVPHQLHNKYGHCLNFFYPFRIGFKALCVCTKYTMQFLFFLLSKYLENINLGKYTLGNHLPWILIIMALA